MAYAESRKDLYEGTIVPSLIPAVFNGLLDLVHVTLSITSLDRRLTAAMEPRTSRPERRLQALEELARAGVPAGVNVAPLIPGLNDSEAPAILEAAAARGASWAHYILVRLPGAVRPLFLDWLERHYPDRAGKVVHWLEAVRGGQLSDARYGHRMRGEGELAELVSRFFKIAKRKAGLDRPAPALAVDKFRGREQISWSCSGRGEGRPPGRTVRGLDPVLPSVAAHAAGRGHTRTNDSTTGLTMAPWCLPALAARSACFPSPYERFLTRLGDSRRPTPGSESPDRVTEKSPDQGMQIHPIG